MPLLKITESKRVTIVATIEESTAEAIEQYAAMTGGTPDEVIQQALDYVFSRDKDFTAHRSAKPAARPKVALRIRRPTSDSATPEHVALSPSAAPGGSR